MRDVTHLAKRLLRAPAHSAAIIVTLALGIGATTTVYSVVRGVLIEPLPFPDDERIVMLWQRAPGVGVEEDWFSPAQYFDLNELAVFEDLAVFGGSGATLTGEDSKPRRVGVLTCSSSLFRVLGITPALGRPLLAPDDVPGTDQKALLSHQLFVQRFGADERVVGRTILLDGREFEVVGVLPELFLDATILHTLQSVARFDVLVSLPLSDPEVTTHGSENFNVMGKLRPRVSAPKLEAELLAVAAAFAEDPNSLAGGLEPGREYRIGVVPLLEQVVGDVRTPLLILFGATGLLLAIACVNVANLLLTRAATQSRQLAIRVALGARRWSVFIGSLLESLVLASLGGVAGLLIAALCLRGVRLLAPAGFPRIQSVAVDPGILGFGALLCIGSSLLFGVGPALRTAGVAPVEVLSEAGPAVPARSVWRRGLSGYLVIAQIALSVMLLVGAGLLLRTVGKLQAVDPGFRADSVLSFRLSFAGRKYADPAARVVFFDRLWDGLADLPGVESAGGVTLLPMTGLYAWTDFSVEGHEPAGDRDRIVADEQFATPGYFRTMGVPLLAGRDFNKKDGADPRVAIVDRAFAERFWSVDEAIGKWIINYPSDSPATIVGVVDSIKHYGLGDAARMTAFFPYRSRPVRAMYGVVAVVGAPKDLISEVELVVASLDPDLPVYEVRAVSTLLDDSLSRERSLAYLLNLFSGAALVLATIGLYGVLSFAVATHAHELAIRMALGARRRDLFRLVLRRARSVTFVGIGLGAAAAAAVAGIFDDLVFGIETFDPLTFVAAVSVVAGVGLIASYLPARRASKVDPMAALKRY